MSQFKHYWFYPVAYAYGNTMNPVKLDRKPHSLFSRAFVAYITDTLFIHAGTWCDIQEVQS